MSETFIQGTERPTSELFQTDELAASEYLREHKRATPLYPEQRLLFAVLQDAIACFQRLATSDEKKDRQLYESATKWIFEQPSDAPVTFEMACEACGFDADYLRSGLQEWRAGRKHCASDGAASDHRNRQSAKSRQGKPRNRASRPNRAPTLIYQRME